MLSTIFWMPLSSIFSFAFDDKWSHLAAYQKNHNFRKKVTISFILSKGSVCIHTYILATKNIQSAKLKPRFWGYKVDTLKITEKVQENIHRVIFRKRSHTFFSYCNMLGALMNTIDWWKSLWKFRSGFWDNKP